MRFLSILCLCAVLGVSAPSASLAQSTPDRVQSQAQNPTQNAASQADPAETPPAAGSAAPTGQPSQQGSAGDLVPPAPERDGAVPRATDFSPDSAAPGVQTGQNVAPATAASAGQGDASIPTPGELGDRLLSEVPLSAPEKKKGWTVPAPVLTLHGYFRARGELQDKFFLGREVGADPNAPDPFSRFRATERGGDGSQSTTNNDLNCGGVGSETEGDNTVCKINTLKYVNMRFRFSPQLSLSEDIRIKSTFDILDNYTWGTGSQSYYGTGSVANAVFASTDNPSRTLIVPRRIWAEVRNRDLGELRFGLMPDHWGLGMLYNAGNGLDDDYSTDVPRVMVTTKLAGILLSAAYDWLNEGTTRTLPGASSSSSANNGPGVDTSQIDDLDQFTFQAVRRIPDEDDDAVLSRGDVLLEGGVRLQLRHQGGVYLSESEVTNGQSAGFRSLHATTYTPDVWAQMRYRHLRLGLEAAWVLGSMRDVQDNSRKKNISQFGFALESELRLVNDKLGLYFYTGGASGDSDVEGLSSDADYISGANGTNSNVSTFRMHPAYRVDLILWRTIMRQVTGAMYFKPGISYDLLKDSLGQLFGLRVDLIYSRAMAPVQTWGNSANLGVEIDAQLYWRSSDGPNVNDGYHLALQYGVLFPMQGLGYLPSYRRSAGDTSPPDLATAQTLRLILGVAF